MTVSRMTVPMIQPTTARVASFSDLGGEELLVHRLVAEHEQAGGQEEFEGTDGGEVAEELKVRGGEGGVMADQPPAMCMRIGSATISVNVASRPMARSM